MRLPDRRKYSQFWPILTRFVAYCSPLSGPETISIVAEPQGAHTCQSSTLAVLADSGPFRGLLLTVLGSRSDFHDRRTPVCVYVSVINTGGFRRFWSVSSTITHRFGVSERFPRLTIPEVCLCVHRQHSQFYNSDPFRGLLLTVLGSRSDFHDRRTPVCVYVSVINTGGFRRFWSVSCTITHRFGVPKGFP